MLKELKNNLKQEKEIVSQLQKIYSSIEDNPASREKYLPQIKSLLRQMKMLNDAVPGLLKTIKPYKALSEQKQKGFESINNVTINKKDGGKYLGEVTNQQNKANLFIRFANKLFFNVSRKLAPRFSSLKEDLRKANIALLVNTYISLGLFSSLCMFILGLIGFFIFLIFDISFIRYVWVVFLLPLLVLVGFYLYPASERSAAKKKISQELPFVTIHMAAIAGANIEGSKIFRIIANSKEYPNVGKEMKKILAQLDLYGYDLVTSLRNVASNTSSNKLSELLNGLATNISSGGGLKEYLQEKSRTYLNDYRLERQRYSSVAGTFMDIYISVLIAAPLVLMMMFIVMNVSGLQIASLTLPVLLFISVGAVVLINIIFLFILHLKQPGI
ncbi:MAG: type II secretion system F family protein [Candidatus Nanoarchaeia archaeon]